MNKPLLIILSCTRNYGWVTRAFLEGNSRWADYIVIVDQMSTDGTREMCAEYGEKVVIVDDPDMNYKESTRAIMSFYKGRELAGDRDHIFFALDIDEVMPANWMETNDGQKILHSKPGDEFCIHWANLNPDNKTYFEDGFTNPWDVQYKVFHDEPNKEFKETGKQMHSNLLPYMNWNIPPYEVKDFLLLHFGSYYKAWNLYKLKYYQVLDVRQKRSKSLVSLCRTYNDIEPYKECIPIKVEWLFEDWNIFKSIDMENSPIFIDYIKEIIETDGIKKYAKLNIWTEDLCTALNLENPSKWHHRLFHWYITNTQSKHNVFFIRAFDKLLKFFV